MRPDFVTTQTLARARMSEWEMTGDPAHLAEVLLTSPQVKQKQNTSAYQSYLADRAYWSGRWRTTPRTSPRYHHCHLIWEQH